MNKSVLVVLPLRRRLVVGPSSGSVPFLTTLGRLERRGGLLLPRDIGLLLLLAGRLLGRALGVRLLELLLLLRRLVN